jgi:uncharacterized protein (DUF1778 family)
MTTRTKTATPRRAASARSISVAAPKPAAKHARLEGRIATEIKNLIAHAAALSGSSFTDFIVAAARERAMAVIRDNQILTLSARDAKAFQEALDNPPPASPRLQKAFKRYKALQNPA